jgi:hypothetical protein
MTRLITCSNNRCRQHIDTDDLDTQRRGNQFQCGNCKQWTTDTTLTDPDESGRERAAQQGSQLVQFTCPACGRWQEVVIGPEGIPYSAIPDTVLECQKGMHCHGVWVPMGTRKVVREQLVDGVVTRVESDEPYGRWAPAQFNLQERMKAPDTKKSTYELQPAGGLFSSRR